MSDRDRPMSPRSEIEEQGRAGRAVAELSEAPADRSFRERLRREFSGGAISSARPPSPRHRLVLRRGWIPLGAAAALAAGLLWTLAQRPGVEWQVLSANGDGEVWIDDRAVASSALEPGRRLPAGARIRTAAGTEVRVLLPRTLAVEVTARTDAVLPSAADRGPGGLLVGRLESGEIRLVTGSDLRGGLVRIQTPEAEAEAVGTTFAVIRDSSGTCICSFAGEVRLGYLCAPKKVVPNGRRLLLSVTGAAAEQDIDEQERMKLQMLHDRSSSLFEGSE